MSASTKINFHASHSPQIGKAHLTLEAPRTRALELAREIIGQVLAGEGDVVLYVRGDVTEPGPAVTAQDVSSGGST